MRCTVVTRIVTLVSILWILALLQAFTLPLLTRPDNPGDGQVRYTIRVALLCYFLTCMILTSGNANRLARLIWSLGCISYFIHVALAFHHHFEWSHEAAIQHTQERSGFGQGIYASHLFTLAWTFDVLWWWVSCPSYQSRRAWIGYCLHGFMAFMVFNATIIFEQFVIRWLGVVFFLSLIVIYFFRLITFSPQAVTLEGDPPC